VKAADDLATASNDKALDVQDLYTRQTRTTSSGEIAYHQLIRLLSVCIPQMCGNGRVYGHTPDIVGGKCLLSHCR